MIYSEYITRDIMAELSAGSIEQMFSLHPIDPETSLYQSPPSEKEIKIFQDLFYGRLQLYLSWCDISEQLGHKRFRVLQNIFWYMTKEELENISEEYFVPLPPSMCTQASTFNSPWYYETLHRMSVK